MSGHKKQDPQGQFRNQKKYAADLKSGPAHIRSPAFARNCFCSSSWNPYNVALEVN